VVVGFARHGQLARVRGVNRDDHARLFSRFLWCLKLNLKGSRENIIQFLFLITQANGSLDPNTARKGANHGEIRGCFVTKAKALY
jgi:hypothetical protein